MLERYLQARLWLGKRPRAAFAIELAVVSVVCAAYLTAVAGQTPASALVAGVVFGFCFAFMRHAVKRYTD